MNEKMNLKSKCYHADKGVWEWITVTLLKYCRYGVNSIIINKNIGYIFQWDMEEYKF